MNSQDQRSLQNLIVSHHQKNSPNLTVFHHLESLRNQKSFHSTFSSTNSFNTAKCILTFSLTFSNSEDFNATEVFDEKLPVDIQIKEEEESGITLGMNIGIGVAIAAGVVGVILVALGLIYLKRRKINQIEVRETAGTSVVTTNPLAAMINSDNHFEDSFQSNVLIDQVNDVEHFSA